MGRKRRAAASEHPAEDRADAGAEVVGAQGLPIRAYRGWDEAAGVFRMDDPATQPSFIQRARARAAAAAPVGPAECPVIPPEASALFPELAVEAPHGAKLAPASAAHAAGRPVAGGRASRRRPAARRTSL